MGIPRNLSGDYGEPRPYVEVDSSKVQEKNGWVLSSNPQNLSDRGLLKPLPQGSSPLLSLLSDIFKDQSYGFCGGDAANKSYNVDLIAK